MQNWINVSMFFKWINQGYLYFKIWNSPIKSFNTKKIRTCNKKYVIFLCMTLYCHKNLKKVKTVFMPFFTSRISMRLIKGDTSMTKSPCILLAIDYEKQVRQSTVNIVHSSKWQICVGSTCECICWR